MKSLFTFVLLFFCQTVAFADIGSVIELSGVAMITRNNKTIKVEQGTSVQMNDSITTKNGKLKVKFQDDTTVLLTESSSLLIDDFVYSPSSKYGRLGLKATSGTVRYVSGKIAHSNPNAVKITTPTASVAVRGTDFVMSVAESGESLIVLMPACEVAYNINLKSLDCRAGIIDVTSGGVTVTLDTPYQSTSVSALDSPPTKPVILSLDNVAINNNLLISPPKINSDNNSVSTRNTRDDGPKQEINNRVMIDQVKSPQDYDATQRVIEVSKYLTSLGVTITDVTDNPNVSKIYSDSSETIQTGWLYGRISPSGGNQVSIVMSLDTRALLVITQDFVTDAYVSNTQSTRAYGTIVVNQRR
jgi:hypothetical protein